MAAPVPQSSRYSSTLWLVGLLFMMILRLPGFPFRRFFVIAPYSAISSKVLPHRQLGDSLASSRFLVLGSQDFRIATSTFLWCHDVLPAKLGLFLPLARYIPSSR